MKWLIQEFINSGSNYQRMVQALDSLSIDYLIVSIDQNNKLWVVEKESKTFLDDSQLILEEFISNSDVMVYGSKTFAIIAQNMNLNPGSFMTDNFEFEVLREQFGKELLNYEFMVGDLFSLEPAWDSFFIRPTGNTKLFTGMAITLPEFNEWRERESVPNSRYQGAKLMIAPTCKIDAEYRFFVVDGKIVTGSSYKVRESIDTSVNPSKEIVEYTKRMVDLFPLARAYVIDIAETPDGYKIIECNNINSSGLYNCDEYEFIKAINNMKMSV